MKAKALLPLLAALLCATLCACSVFDRSYTSVTTHVDQYVSEDDPTVLRAETYQELVSSILHFVTEGEELGVVRLYQYTGDVESDLASACEEVLLQDPLGAYALEGLEHSYTRIVSYYECTFTLRYLHTAEEINSIATSSSLVSFREQLQQTMDSFGNRFAVRTSLSLSEEEIRTMIEDYYLSNPRLALGMPGISISFYGSEEGTQRIIEVELSYLQDSEGCLLQQQELLSMVSALLSELSAAAEDGSVRSCLWSIYEELSSWKLYSAMGTGSAYLFLSEGYGTQQGAALALLLLCQQLGLDCSYVAGELVGQDCCWVMVQVEDTWCHLVLSLQDGETGFLRGDEGLLALGYSWDQSAYPACAGLETEDEALPEAALPEDMELELSLLTVP